jgi:hypothetical protein
MISGKAQSIATGARFARRQYGAGQGGGDNEYCKPHLNLPKLRMTSERSAMAEVP